MSEKKAIRCSSLPRLSLCPGSLKASEGLESRKTSISESGDRIHMALEAYYLGSEFDETRMSDRESMVYRWFRKEADELIASRGGAVAVIPEMETAKEIRGTDVVLTGHIDLCVLFEDGTKYAIDWKTGHLEVPEAKENKQLFGYAYLLLEDAPVNAYLFSAGNENVFSATEFSDLDALEGFIAGVAMEAYSPDAKRVCGEEQCKYCPAAGTDRCPESKALVTDAAERMDALAKSDEMLPASNDDVVRIYKAIKQVESIGRRFMAKLDESVSGDPDRWAGIFEMKPGNSVRSIADVQGAYEKVVESAGIVPASEFLGIVDLKIGALEALLKQPLKDAGVKVKDHKAYIEDLLGDLIEMKQNKPSVKFVGKN